ncbi:trypsin delta-like [Anticarsia gemmatalis]|uniref:trypsin delta-like n=1 Tax=Anticarsia gemmatalis TaxID=129554 RepID=UPI003F7749B8
MLVAKLLLFLSQSVLSYCMESYIVHGDYAKISMFSYTAFLSIQCVEPDEDEVIPWICGSSIVNQYILLTAGHCLNSCVEETHITVSVGHEVIMQGAVASASSFVVHNKYSDDTVANDISVVKIRNPLQFNINVTRLAIMKNPPYNQKAFVAGWGVDGSSLSSEKLKFTKQYVWKGQKCCIICLQVLFVPTVKQAMRMKVTLEVHS